MRVGSLEVPAGLLAADPKRRGSSSYILHSPDLEGWLASQYGARPLCLKVFCSTRTPEDEWEFVPLREAAEVQNLFAAEGWAPRVYALGQLNGGDVAEVVEYADMLDPSPPDGPALAPFWALVDRYGVGTRSRVHPGGALKWDFLLQLAADNWAGGRLLDWGGKYRRWLYPEWDEPQPSRIMEGREAEVMILNLGCGNRIQQGAVNHDIAKHRPEIDIVHDLNERPWPWPDNSADMIDARSVFEHLRLTLIETADECWRILRPSGRLVVMYPLAGQATSYQDPTHRWHWTEESLDYLDPDTRHGQDYAYYTARKWRILSRGVIKDRNVKAVLEVRK